MAKWMTRAQLMNHVEPLTPGESFFGAFVAIGLALLLGGIVAMGAC